MEANMTKVTIAKHCVDSLLKSIIEYFKKKEETENQTKTAKEVAK